METLILFVTLVAMFIIGYRAARILIAYSTARHYGLPLREVKWRFFIDSTLVLAVCWLVARVAA